MLRVIALVETGTGLLRARVGALGCVLVAAACGGRADSTLLHAPCADGVICESRGETEGEEQDDPAAVQEGESPPDGSGSVSDDEARQAGTGETCSGAVEVALAHFRESQAPGPSMPSFDEEGQLIVPELALSLCDQCISTCSPAPTRGCSAQDNCVKSHCDCSGTGCENGIPTGDFCLCAATCMGPGQESCLESWVPYGQCLATCVSVCT